MAECVDGSCQVRCLTREEKRDNYDHHSANARDTWQGLRDDLIRIGHEYCNYTIDVADIDECLHDAWDELFFAAKAIPCSSSELDRLVILILELREFGPLVRPARIGNDEEPAVMPTGERLWTDLPYFVADLRRFWENEAPILPGPELESLAAFTAKLCASGVFAQDLSWCELQLFKMVLEKENPPCGDCNSTKDSSGSDGISGDRVKACVQWLTYANFKLARLSIDGLSPNDMEQGNEVQESVSLGQIAVEAGVKVNGFSLQRWLFWRQKFGEMYLHGNEEVSMPSRKAFELMIGTGLAIGLNIPGEKRYLEQLFKALETELALRDFTGCVTPEDIEIDPNWANEP
ncbi:hypothetical protein BGZ63DRAFT_406655 [Mariannaea sp. PMI_226]|nr:hypothetical protein BGZ63DRAFT_406655 [Mariannaea sp. PMI_226]